MSYNRLSVQTMASWVNTLVLKKQQYFIDKSTNNIITTSFQFHCLIEVNKSLYLQLKSY
uniref:Uncharacterized protein n=1 Tax=Arion vulgaris TaxID=1028688 RepID=A0A0B7BJN2_9EUPU